MNESGFIEYDRNNKVEFKEKVRSYMEQIDKEETDALLLLKAKKHQAEVTI